MSRPVFPGRLPDLGIRLISGWIPVLMEPLPDQTKSGLHVVNSEFDSHMDKGYAWVLAVPKTFRFVPPYKLKKAPDRDNHTFVWTPEVKRGDKVIFKRYERTSAKALGNPLSDEDAARFPEYEAFYLHYESLLAIVIEE